MQLADKLRLGMRRLASGVCVVSAQKSDVRSAMTASSVTSLSDSPASLLVCINKSASISQLLAKGQNFAVNVLSSEQEAVSNKCADRKAGDERFSVGDWDLDETSQSPYLQSSQVIFFCTVDNEPYEYGTHQIMIGRMTDILIPNTKIDPLIYVNGRYHRL